MAFDPNEARDQGGKWTSGGGEGMAHQSGMDSIPRAGITAFHGTTQDFQGMPQGPPKEDFMLDRMLGVHYAADPEISNSFVTERVNGRDVGPKTGGRIYEASLPSEDKFLEVDQPRLPYLVGDDTRYNEMAPWQRVLTDQNQVEKMVMKVAYQKDPAMLARYIETARAEPHDSAVKAANDLVAGKSTTLKVDGKVKDLDSFLNNMGGRPYNAPDRAKAVDLARSEWQRQGYKGLKYIDTSPMENETAKNPRAYILFDSKDAKTKFGK